MSKRSKVNKEILEAELNARINNCKYKNGTQCIYLDGERDCVANSDSCVETHKKDILYEKAKEIKEKVKEIKEQTKLCDNTLKELCAVLVPSILELSVIVVVIRILKQVI